jgi:putative sigma-54 modulation protein
MVDRYVKKPMTVEEAAMQLELVDNDFLVFYNNNAERVNVIYQRKDGDFGLIDPKF